MNGLHAIKAPSGRFVLVGRVPVRAGYERKDGAPLTDDDIRGVCHCGPGIFPHIRTRSFATAEEALSAGAEHI